MHLHAYLLIPLFLPGVSAQLNHYAQAAGLKFFGTAVDNGALGNAAYMAIARDADEFGSVTPANGQKWANTEASRGSFGFGMGDAVAAVAGERLMRCHTLVWHNQLPGWVNSIFSRSDMESVITTHITNVMNHYKGQCYSWDVVNEAVEDDGSFRQSPMFRAMGEDFIAHSFKVAASVDPAAKLYYNDFNIERYINDKIRAVRALVSRAQAAGARIDGIGMQDHARVGSAQSQKELTDTMEFFAEVVDELAYTEVDIRHTRLPVGDEEREQQARDYVEMVRACLAVEKCVGITVWDFADQYSWIPNEFPGEGEACLFDRNLQKKPAYHSVLSVLQSAAAERTAAPEITATATTLETVATADPAGK
ncbi:related to endo-1,4-beta-xylanase [Cephalotrichum gorgonifer]|uniref:Beta-xylanase n=1 Tax=Cephalotrichum gorgonifer TaxID=2041049 RepID=A0AAE8N6P9_9PEZI|nr:related to endo-1,4-beta-xylanase [Cephalotrichum gorgonifer]